MKNKLFNIRMPLDLYDYIRKISEIEYTTMSKYIISLILKDKKNREKK